MSNPENYTSVDAALILKHIREFKPEIDFEKMFPGRTEEFAAIIARLYMRLYGVIEFPDQNKISPVQFYSALLAWKATTTGMGALELFRRGYPTEAVALLRNVVETAAVILHMFTMPNLYDAVLKGGHDPTKSIGPAKQIIPIMGKLYGALCTFAHSKPASSIPGHVRGSEQRKTTLLIGGGFDDSQKYIYALLLNDIELVMQVLENAIELPLHPFLKDIRYWRVTEGGIVPSKDEEDRARMSARIREMEKLMREAGIDASDA